MDRGARNVTPAMIDVLRSAAEQMLARVVDDGIQAAAPDIEKSALRAAMDAHFTEAASTMREERGTIVSHIDRRTSFLPAFFTNLAAWFVTLLVAVAIVFLFNRPSVEQTILKRTAAPQQEQVEAPQQPTPQPILEDRTGR